MVVFLSWRVRTCPFTSLFDVWLNTETEPEYWISILRFSSCFSVQSAVIWYFGWVHEENLASRRYVFGKSFSNNNEYSSLILHQRNGRSSRSSYISWCNIQKKKITSDNTIVTSDNTIGSIKSLSTEMLLNWQWWIWVFQNSNFCLKSQILLVKKHISCFPWSESYLILHKENVCQIPKWRTQLLLS